jgi:hypothetical protein
MNILPDVPRKVSLCSAKLTAEAFVEAAMAKMEGKVDRHAPYVSEQA